MVPLLSCPSGQGRCYTYLLGVAICCKASYAPGGVLCVGERGMKKAPASLRGPLLQDEARLLRYRPQVPMRTCPVKDSVKVAVAAEHRNRPNG